MSDARIESISTCNSLARFVRSTYSLQQEYSNINGGVVSYYSNYVHGATVIRPTGAYLHGSNDQRDRNASSADRSSNRLLRSVFPITNLSPKFTTQCSKRGANVFSKLEQLAVFFFDSSIDNKITTIPS